MANDTTGVSVVGVESNVPALNWGRLSAARQRPARSAYPPFSRFRCRTHHRLAVRWRKRLFHDRQRDGGDLLRHRAVAVLSAWLPDGTAAHEMGGCLHRRGVPSRYRARIFELGAGDGRCSGTGRLRPSLAGRRGHAGGIIYYNDRNRRRRCNNWRRFAARRLEHTRAPPVWFLRGKASSRRYRRSGSDDAARG